jgi:V/A-type H+-transporting ATPase subunit D
MGVRYPSGASVTTTPEPDAVVDNAAVVPALEATRIALLAGVRAAAADEAVRRIEAEIDVTRRRLHALDRRWLPWLDAELARLELALEQSEHEDGVRLRRASADTPHRTGPSGPRSADRRGSP